MRCVVVCLHEYVHANVEHATGKPCAYLHVCVDMCMHIFLSHTEPMSAMIVQPNVD
jgi:hypothetical protein